ncbi:MAG: hypothetical protein ACE5RN_04930 [Nitrosopumilaceae archaeon]
MSGIRVTYSGIIAFLASFATVITGLIFTVIITRGLSQDEFGTWALIGTFTSYVYFLSPTVSYWCTREIARGQESGKTAFASTGIFASIAFFGYLLIVYFFNETIEVDLTLLFFAGILVPAEFFNTILKSINQGFRPQMEEYGFLIFEIVKIPLALVLIFYFEFGLMGLIITIFLSNLASIALLLITTRQKLHGKFQIKFLKKWIKLFWVPIYPYISVVVNVTDVALVTIFTGSVGVIAYWSASRAVAHIVAHSSKIGKAVYPKLLGGGKKEYLQENLHLFFYVSFPIAGISIIFARPALFILNPLYEVAVLVVIFLVPSVFLRAFSELFIQALKGIENVDMIENAGFRDYLRSNLLFLPTLRLIQRAGYLVILAIILILYSETVESEVEIIVYWAIISLGVQIPYTLYLLYLVRKDFKLKLKPKIFLKYLITTVVVFGSIYFLMDEFLVYEESVFSFIPNFIPFFVSGIILYLGITYLIDSRTKLLFHKILNEIKSHR